MESELLLNNIKQSNDIKLTIAIPTYKRPRYLIESLKSIQLQKSSSIKYEVIVVNNDPDSFLDESISSFENLPLKYYRNKTNLGQVGNMNQCIKLSSGQYIAFLHDDDILLPSFLKECEFIIESKYDCVLPRYFDFYKKFKFDFKHRLLRILFYPWIKTKSRFTSISPIDYKKSFINVYDLPSCGTIFKKASLIEYGFFKNERGAAWDYYNFRLFNQNHSVAIYNKCLAARRKYSGMTNSDKVQKEFLDDKIQLMEELQSEPFIKKYKKCMITKKPLFKYFFYRVSQDSYVYRHNLVRSTPLPSKTYKWYIRNIRKEVE